VTGLFLRTRTFPEGDGVINSPYDGGVDPERKNLGALTYDNKNDKVLISPEKPKLIKKRTTEYFKFKYNFLLDKRLMEHSFGENANYNIDEILNAIKNKVHPGLNSLSEEEKEACRKKPGCSLFEDYFDLDSYTYKLEFFLLVIFPPIADNNFNTCDFFYEEVFEEEYDMFRDMIQNGTIGCNFTFINYLEYYTYYYGFEQEINTYDKNKYEEWIEGKY
jgi:hypothetical protein